MAKDCHLSTDQYGRKCWKYGYFYDVDGTLHREIQEEEWVPWNSRPGPHVGFTEQHILALILNPRCGKHWQSEVNGGFHNFLQEHPVFLQKYVLTIHWGKHRSPKAMEEYFSCEQQLLEEYCYDKDPEYNQIDIVFLDTNTTPRKSWYHDRPPPGDLRIVGYLSCLNGYLKRCVHKFFMDFLARLRHEHTRPTKFEYLGTEILYQYKRADADSVTAVDQQKADGKKFDQGNMAKREKLFGHYALNRIMLPEGEQDPSFKFSKKGEKWKKKVLSREDLQHKFLHQYEVLKEIHRHCVIGGKIPFRTHWLRVFPQFDCQGEYVPGHGYCACADLIGCRTCNIRFAQAAILVFACQGVADRNILPYLGAVFKSPRYVDLGIQEWAMISTYELAALLKPCSSQGLKACYLKGLFEYMSQHLDLPLTLGHLTCFYGLQKKSACLLLTAVAGQPFGIPVDRHLLNAFRNLGWVYRGCANATEMSYLVELWLPKEETAIMNDVIASIRQLVARDPVYVAYKARRGGLEHLAMLKILVKDFHMKNGWADTPWTPPGWNVHYFVEDEHYFVGDE